jgi:hypothetical protein
MTLATDLSAALDPAALFRDAFGLEPLDWQRDFLRANGNLAVLKGRQVGASTCAAALCIHLILYHPDVNAIVISPSQKQSQEIAKRARSGLRRLGVSLVEDSASVLRLRNNSRLVSLPGTSRSVRGWTAQLLILDECAFLLEETIVAASALVATGGRTAMLSTPADAVGTFHAVVTGDDEDWTRFTVRSDEVATISSAFLGAQRRKLPPDEYQREFEAVFGKTGARLFDMAAFEAVLVYDDEPQEVPV